MLSIGVLREPATVEGFTGQGGVRGGASEEADLIHNHLTVLDPQETARPQLATELPSVENGTWKINQDGTMDMTWKLHPGVKWQDGTPFTSDDLLFSLMLHKDPDLAHSYRAQTNAMESATAPDPLTLIVHWSRVDIRALEGLGLTPMPRHLMEELYRTDKNSFIQSTRFTSDWVGLGPYRLTNWVPGSQMEMVRNEDYFLGRPLLDRVIVRFIGDPNAMVANLLAGSIELVIPPSIEIETALNLKQQWEGTGNVVRLDPLPRIDYMELQFRPEAAKPVNGLPVLAVRQALYQAIDRQVLSQAMTGGLAPPADSWFSPLDPARKDVESAIPQFPYDPARARQLLAQAGWQPGADGVLVHSPSGERFSMEMWTNPQTSDKITAIVADAWKAIGVNGQITAIPPARAEDREFQSQHPGPLITGVNIPDLLDRYDSRQVASPANRWSGRNRAGYANQRADQLLDQLATTIDLKARVPLQREQVQIVMGEVGMMPLFWEPRPLVALKSVKGDISAEHTGWNAFTWDKQ
ncbi:MAG: peptide/nickel transport system substrate-binding protein [Chloroflexota bacterium]|nr:peptide/nickel transport system substrate-binding protein [Chloroflexota bacterium]